MKLSSLLLVVLVVAVFSTQTLSDSPGEECRRLDLLWNYLDISEYNQSYPFVTYEQVIKPLREIIGGSVSENAHDYMVYWLEICDAKTPESVQEAWENMAKLIRHRLHMDQSFHNVTTFLLDHRLSTQQAMKAKTTIVVAEGDYGLEDCIQELLAPFRDHCGELYEYDILKHIGDFIDVCEAGVKRDDVVAAFKLCNKGYSKAPRLFE